jgi:hypothetical protein
MKDERKRISRIEGGDQVRGRGVFAGDGEIPVVVFVYCGIRDIFR